MVGPCHGPAAAPLGDESAMTPVHSGFVGCALTCWAISANTAALCIIICIITASSSLSSNAFVSRKRVDETQTASVPRLSWRELLKLVRIVGQ
eukprot:COSAG02_NODE_2515_length_8621_cov_13.085074_2_plen_93_part_00